MLDWDRFLSRLRSYPPKVHELRPACPLDRIKQEEAKLGPFPTDLSVMLEHFNGGELFIDAVPFLTIFGLSLPTDQPDFDWFIDRYTPKWRCMLNGSAECEWAIGMTNYGGVVVLGENLIVREWDSSQHKWDAAQHSLSEWVENLLSEGAAYLNE